MEPTELRQNEIFQQYYFVCECSRCTDEKETAKMMGANCPNPKCDNCALDLRKQISTCPQCDKPIDQDHQDMYDYLMQFTPTQLYEMSLTDCGCKLIFY